MYLMRKDYDRRFSLVGNEGCKISECFCMLIFGQLGDLESVSIGVRLLWKHRNQKKWEIVGRFLACFHGFNTSDVMEIRGRRRLVRPVLCGRARPHLHKTLAEILAGEAQQGDKRGRLTEAKNRGKTTCATVCKRPLNAGQHYCTKKNGLLCAHSTKVWT